MFYRTSYEFNLNPWLSIWRKPGETVIHILDSNHGKLWWLLLLSSMAGMYDVFLYSLNRDFNVSTVIFLMFTLGLVGGVAILLLESYIFFVVGKIFKGESTWSDMLRAVAWSKIPLIVSLVVCFLPMILIYGDSLFNPQAAEPVPSSMVILWIIFVLLFLVLLTWYIYIISSTIARVHGITFWRGFAIYLISKVVYTFITSVVFLVTVGILVSIGI